MRKLEEIVFSSDKNKKVYPLCGRGYAPEIGSVFSSFVGGRKDGRGDYVLYGFKNYTGYAKGGEYIKEELKEGEFYRFIVVSVHSLNFHNYFYAIPFRKLGENESHNINLLSPCDFLKIKKIAERLFGFRVHEKSL